MVDVIFMGTPDYASTILEALIADKSINVKSVYTQPDKPVGRKKILTAPIVKEVALKHNIEVIQPSRLRDEESVASVLECACDFIIVAAYGQILPKSILDHAPCINLHASILPAYRGASPIQLSLLNGDAKSGVTAMRMDEGLDTGDILKISEVVIGDDTMVSELFDALTVSATALTLDVIKNFESFTPVPQDNAKATHCKKISKADGEVILDDAQAVYNKYRAYTPWPGIYLSSGLKLKEIALHVKETNHSKSALISEIHKNSIVLTCKEGSLEVFRVQPNSKKEMSVIDYINGKRLNIGDTLS